MYYFAYGSNMVFEHMRRLCGWHFHVLDTAVLPDFELVPDKRGYVSISPKVGSKVFGLLYLVDRECLDVLDEFKGHPEVFHRIEVQVRDISGESFNSWVYAESSENLGGDCIKQEYLNRIIAAAEANRLPSEWVSFLQTFRITA